MSLSSFKYREVFAVYAYSCYGTSQPTAVTSKEVSALFVRSQEPISRAFCKVERVKEAEDGIFSLQRSSLSDQRERDMLLADIDNMISAQQGAFKEFKQYLPQLR